ncbi:MAG: exosortase/archaeosortase family protein [Candidatus Omnitrophica bacterium]|nr:exosortase/archaeosortase family protein [Candidatus Omnitrophota bacterium]
MKNYIKTGIIAILLSLIYWPTFVWMWGRWNVAETYYSHGILIPVASLFFLWQKKEDLLKQKITTSNLGIVVIIVGLLLHFGGVMIKLYFLSAISLMMLIAGLVLYFLGKDMLKKIMFPMVYLIFMIPLPLVLISNIVLRMKLFAAQMSTVMLNKIGFTAVRDGNIIKMAHSYLEVGAPCSGLRSLISLMAFGAAFAYLSGDNLIKKWVIFFSAFPIAIGANVCRITLLGWVSEVYGMKAAQGWIHDFSGYLLFAIAAVGLLVVNSLLTPSTSEEPHS